MSVGFSAGKTDFDARAGQIALDVRTNFDRVRQFKSVLDAKTDTEFTNMGYTSAEVAILRSAYTDLDKLATIYLGTQTQGTTYDFRTFAKQLTGVV